MTPKIRRSPIGTYRFLAGGLLFLLPAPARAQLQGEVFAGYSYLFSGDLRSGGIQQNGWDISVAGNLARSLGVVADLSNHYRIIPSGFSTIGTKGKGFTFLLGPRYSFRNLWRLTPFAHMLFGTIQGNKLLEGRLPRHVGKVSASNPRPRSPWLSAAGWMRKRPVISGFVCSNWNT